MLEISRNNSEIQPIDLSGLNYKYSLKKCLFPYDYGDYETQIFGSIRLHEDEIGKFSCSVFEVSLAARRNIEIPFFFDSISASGLLIYEELFNSKTDGLKKCVLKNVIRNYDPNFHDDQLDILLIDAIEVKPEFRGHKIASYLIYSLLETLKSLAPIAVVQPGILEDTEKMSEAEIRRRLRKLRQMYANLGFKSLKGCATMYKSLARFYDEPTSLEDRIFDALIEGEPLQA